mgnify:CR=1 FL=1
MALYRDRGVVLRRWKLGEADRILAIYTEEHGKVRAVAKGIRKPTSRFGGRLEPISHVSLQLYRGRDLDTITQVETIDHFREVHDSLAKATRAVSVLEAVDQLTPDRSPDAGLYTMLVGALRAVARNDSPLVVPAFFLKLLAYQGALADLDTCVVCGRDQLEAGPLVGVDPALGGSVCEHCAGPNVAGLTPAAMNDAAGVFRGHLRELLAREPRPYDRQIELAASSLLEYHLERRLRSLSVADRLS